MGLKGLTCGGYSSTVAGTLGEEEADLEEEGDRYWMFGRDEGFEVNIFFSECFLSTLNFYG